jgi:hypothetical protein
MKNTKLTRWEFQIGDLVLIRDGTLTGRVVGRMEDSTGLQYRVIWWKDQDRQDAWLFGFELGKDQSTCIGFGEVTNG